jgi:protein RecA
MRTNSGISKAFDALQKAGFDVDNRATGETPPVIPLAFDYFNEMTVCGGIPRRRYTQIYGEPHQGKTLLAMHIVAMAQKQEPDRLCVYLDTENTFDRSWAEANGVDFNKLYLIQGNTAEKVLKDAVEVMKTGVVGLVVIDTIGQMIESKGKTASWEDSKELQRNDGGTRQIGAFQKLVTRFCRTASDYMMEHNIAVVGVNQTYTQIGVLYGDPLTTPGGKSWKFNITMDIHVRRVDYLRDTKDSPIVGLKMAVNILKNKLGGPAKTDDHTHLLFYFGEDGIDRAVTYGLIDRGIRVGLITNVPGNAWYEWNEKGQRIRKWQGRARVIGELLSDAELRDQLKKSVEEKEKSSSGRADSGISSTSTRKSKKSALFEESED